jgi:type IV fimbrial biogenesis protein FimT
MLTARLSRGFTLIELMIGLALLAVLLMLAMPTFSTMLQNQKLRAVAESIQAGLQIARVESMKRNQTVEFMLTDDDPVEAGVAGFGATTNGPHWAVRVDTGAGFTFVEGRAGPEGSSATAATLSVVIAAGSLPAGNTIRFDGMGRTNLGAASATFDVSNPAGGACKTAGGNEPMRCLRIVVTPGGRVRMCDPSVTAATDTRSCG